MKKLDLFGKWTLCADLNKTAKKEMQSAGVNEQVTQNLFIEFPSDIHSALIEQKIIPDPYWAKNELTVQWVAKTDWTCTRQIEVPADFLNGKQFITLDGADTFVRVFVNDKEIALCDNFFRKWRFDISGALHEGTNTIKLVFESSEKFAINAAKKLPYPVPCSVYDVTSSHRNFVRKTQCHAGWDWGPCIMAMGVYNELCLEQTEVGFIDYIQTETKRDCDKEDLWNVAVKAHIFAVKDCDTEVEFTVSGEDIEKQTIKVPAKLAIGENQIETNIAVKNPTLWRIASENTLYDVTCTISEKRPLNYVRGDNACHVERSRNIFIATAIKTIKIGFRELRIIANEDAAGKCLYFELNGKPVFAKGANWIPCDALPARQSQAKYEYLLDSLVQANMNTVRVWGGGFYEKDLFYEYCDKKGILVWQDMMFACSMYPANQEFLDNVRIEIRQQIRRLSHHPSIAIWCGNNENLGAINWYEESRANPELYIANYNLLNEGVVGDEVKKNDGSRVWWPSSPSDGMPFDPNNVCDNWHSDSRGDMHYWSVWHEKKPFEAYYEIRPRFVSEFGYESLPSLSELATFLPKNQYNLTSPVMEFHQRSVGGNAIIFENFSRYFRVPSSFEQMCYLSQVQQAIAIKTAVTYWRSLMPHCMGAIYWQLNDVWPIASWSSIEYSGKWKLLHYAAKNFFAPLAVTVYKKDGVIHAYVLNDTEQTFAGNLSLQFLRFDGSSAGDAISIKINVTPQSSTLVWECDVEKLPAPKDEMFIFAELISASGNVVSSDTLFCDVQKHCQLLPANIDVEVRFLDSAARNCVANRNDKCSSRNNTEEGVQDFEIILTAENPAFYVALDAGATQGIFSNNMLTLLPGKKYSVRFTQQPLGGNKNFTPVSLEEFKRTLNVASLNDLW